GWRTFPGYRRQQNRSKKSPPRYWTKSDWTGAFTKPARWTAYRLAGARVLTALLKQTDRRRGRYIQGLNIGCLRNKYAPVRLGEQAGGHPLPFVTHHPRARCWQGLGIKRFGIHQAGCDQRDRQPL